MPKSAWLELVGSRVRVLRKRAGLRQSALGVSPTTVHKLERGDGADLTSIEKISTALGLKNPSELLSTTYPDRTDEEHRLFLAEVQTMFSDPVRRKLAYFVASIPDDELTEFDVHVRGFRKGQTSSGSTASPNRARDRLHRRK